MHEPPVSASLFGLLGARGSRATLGTATHPAEGSPKHLQNPQSLFLLLSLSLPQFSFQYILPAPGPAEASSAVPMETTEPGGSGFPLPRQRQSAACFSLLAAFLRPEFDESKWRFEGDGEFFGFFFNAAGAFTASLDVLITY